MEKPIIKTFLLAVNIPNGFGHSGVNFLFYLFCKLFFIDPKINFYLPFIVAILPIIGVVVRIKWLS